MKLNRIAPVFSVAFAVLYFVCVEYNLALFTYQARLGEWGMLVQPDKGSLAMYWYGWIAVAAFGAMIVSVVSLAIPLRLTARLWRGLVWAVPLCVMIAFTVLLRGYFIR